MVTSYLRKGSTLSSGSQPSEVGMGNGDISRGTPEEAIGTCMWANGNPNQVMGGTLRGRQANTKVKTISVRRKKLLVDLGNHLRVENRLYLR